jgi:ubiquitin-conjugating enzyme E2 Q
MPRKAFVADLSKAVEAGNGSIVGISEVQQGGDDGEFTFMCVADGKKLKISVLIPGTLPVGSLLLHWPKHTT